MRVLVVSYTFPPADEVGVRRVSKLVKVLLDFGVEPILFCVALCFEEKRIR